jgi:spermidine synthase
MAGQTIDRALTSDGGELTLSLTGERYAMRVDGMELMNSGSHRSEEMLAVYGCAGLARKPGARVLIGGLGMGFTARAALDVLGPDAEVVVVESVPAVVRWNRQIFGHLAREPLADPRLSVIEADVVDAIAEAAAGAAAADRYDAILLDVDNGPVAFTTFKNKRLYSEEGLRSARKALRPGAVLAVWSTFQNAAFTARLRALGFDTTAKRVVAGDGSRRRHVLWLARAGSVARSG